MSGSVKHQAEPRCQASSGTAHPSLALAGETFFTSSRARLRRARPGGCPARLRAATRKPQRKSRTGAEGYRHGQAVGRGTRPLRGGSLPSPTGGSPPGAALPPGGCPAPAGRRYRLQRTPVTAPARSGGPSSSRRHSVAVHLSGGRRGPGSPKHPAESQTAHVGAARRQSQGNRRQPSACPPPRPSCPSPRYKPTDAPAVRPRRRWSTRCPSRTPVGGFRRLPPRPACRHVGHTPHPGQA